MKQFILSYKDYILKEAVLTPEQTEKYSKIKVVEDVKEIHDKIFGNQERIYLPFDTSLFDLDTQNKSETQEEIENLLISNGYETISYIQNQCKKVNDSRVTKIGKVLISKAINRKDLADAYALEVDSLRNVKDSNDLIVVFSRNYDDIASMSTKKAWYSCQNLVGGSQNNYVAKDLEQGSIIAYLIKTDDKEILDPEARILIKPFINSKNKKDIVLLPCTKTYHRGLKDNTPLAYPKFPKFVMGWVRQVQPNINGTYRMNNIVYQDGETTLKIKKNFKLISKEEKEKVLNPKTIEYLELSFDYYNLELDISEVKMDSDGLWIYNESIIFSNNQDFKEFPSCFKTLKEIKGGLRLYETSITSFKGLENLKSIGADLFLNKTYITSFKGLENLKTIGNSLNCYQTSVTSFKGLENLKTIGGGLYCYGTSITSFEGLENLESIGEDLNCSTTPLKDFNGLENLTFIGNDLNCTYIQLKNFKGLENLETIGGGLYCYYTQLESFKGLEKLTSIGESLSCSHTPLTSFEGFESLETIGKNLDCSNTHLESFKGLENLTSIGKVLDCFKTPIKSFDGLRKNIKIGRINPEELKTMFKQYKNS